MPFVVKGLSPGSSGDKRVVSRITNVTAIIDFYCPNFYSRTRRLFQSVDTRDVLHWSVRLRLLI